MDDETRSPTGNKPGAGRGLNRVKPEQLEQVLLAIQHAGQMPYAAGSLLPPCAKPDDRWPMLGAALPARVWQLAGDASVVGQWRYEMLNRMYPRGFV